MSLNPDRLFVHKTLIYYRLNRGQDALEGALAGMANRVDDVGLEHEVTIARIERWVDAVTGPRIYETIHVFRQRLVDVDDHRVLLVWIEVRRLDQHRRERNTVGILKSHELRCSPQQLGL